MTMQPATPEEWAELQRAVGGAVRGIEAMNGARVRHATATTFVLAFLLQELEACGGLDLAALAEATFAGLRPARPPDH